MKRVFVKRALFVVLGFVAFGALNACIVVHEHGEGGPPPHAPAYGYRSHYHHDYDDYYYYYYPSSYVYFDIEKKIYFYFSSGSWHTAHQLPQSIKLTPGDRVKVKVKGGKPYLYNQEHKQKYGPGKSPPGKPPKKQKKDKKKDKWN